MVTQVYVKGFKAFEKDLTCLGFQYEVGKTYRHDGEIAICRAGFHFCEHPQDVFGYYPWNPREHRRPPYRFCEVEAFDHILSGTSKSVTNCIRICRELSLREVLNAVNYHSFQNVGYGNVGCGNIGRRNMGNCNFGDGNIGSRNIGDGNAGGYNAGDSNTGDSNVGDKNTGDRNAGYRNAGFGNYGCDNTGQFCFGTRLHGTLCTANPSTFYLFNKPADRHRWDYSVGASILDRFMLLPHKRLSVGLELKQWYWMSWRVFWSKLSLTEKLAILDIENFDPDIWYEITSIRIKPSLWAWKKRRDADEYPSALNTVERRLLSRREVTLW